MSSRVRIAAGAPICQQHLTGWLDLRRADSKRRTFATTDRRDAANWRMRSSRSSPRKDSWSGLQPEKSITVAALARESTIAVASERQDLYQDDACSRQ